MTYKQQLQWEEENNQVEASIMFLWDVECFLTPEELDEEFLLLMSLSLRFSQQRMAQSIFWEYLNGPADIRVILSLKAMAYYTAHFYWNMDVDTSKQLAIANSFFDKGTVVFSNDRSIIGSGVIRRLLGSDIPIIVVEYDQIWDYRTGSLIWKDENQTCPDSFDGLEEMILKIKSYRMPEIFSHPVNMQLDSKQDHFWQDSRSKKKNQYFKSRKPIPKKIRRFNRHRK